jgi:hypothetical protein
MRDRRFVVGGALLLVVLLAAIVVVSRGTERAISFWSIDDQTLGVQVIDGENSTCEVTSVTESSLEVRVAVECRGPLFSAGSTGAGYPHDFSVHLQEPLGGRRVLDAFGSPARQCEEARCGFSA